MMCFIQNFRFNPLKEYRALITTLNDYLSEIESKLENKDYSMLISQFPDLINPFNEMIDWIVQLNSGLNDVIQFKIKL